MQTQFDPDQKEAELQRESQSWEINQVQDALPGDIPLIDIEEYFDSGSDQALDSVASLLRDACLKVGFFSIVGHQFPADTLRQTFVEAHRFHDLDEDAKMPLLMDQPGWPVGGVGYMPVNNRKLPARKKGNLNESMVFKRDHNASLDDNLWPREDQIPGFRKNIEAYMIQIEKLALKLLPIYARALELDKDFFEPAFTQPLYRMRLTRYPIVPGKAEDEFGIPPHVDTTFFTILAQNSPGLVIYNEQRQCWIHAPVIENAFIVNSGELLKQWTNDKFISVKHFADNNTGQASRFSIPFFFNANADYKMACIPSCCSEDNPPKYPTISYLESQGVVQGE
jgi:isopenicillin N synthase-like dioxygenase